MVKCPMTHQPEPPHTALPIFCPKCGQKQFIHVAPRVGIAQAGTHTVHCVNCKAEINLDINDQIVGEPFLGQDDSNSEEPADK
jgi:hypothetical protein